ncbi:MAG: non-canonical purine NTP pyrophosphatase [Acidobacteria bacterium]|nr:non-canonical purine NTP pyrophosphatase [Acidobacteriota bacterium]
MLTLCCTTANPGKLAEFRLAAPPELQIAATGPFDCPETGRSFEENAIQKALCYARHVNALLFADDSGLEVDALGGEPGIRSARYAGPLATDEQNRALLIENLRRVSGAFPSCPRARFVCVVALALPGRLLATFRGQAEGNIIDAPRGAGGFGYDPLFYFPPLGRTFAELDPEEKFLHSHRGQAFRAMLEWLRKHGGEIQGGILTPCG